MNVNYKSDFKVRVQPTLGGEPVDITEHDFDLVFTTSGGARKYVCSKRGEVLTNCTIEDTAIACVFDNHRLPCGVLQVAVYDYAPDADYPDGNELTVTPSTLDVTLVVGAGDGSEVSGEVVVDVSAAIANANMAADAARAAAERAEHAAEVGLDGYTRAEVDALLDDKAGAPMVVNITSEEIEGETVYHADKTTAEIHAAVLAGRNVVAHHDTYEFMLDAVEANIAIFSLSYANGVEQLVIGNGSVVLNNITFADGDEFEVAQQNITNLQNNKADKVAVIDVSGTDVTQELQPNTFYRFGSVDSLTLTLAAAPSGVLAIYACSFVAASASTTLTLPASVVGEAPSITAGSRYELNIMDNVLLYTENE